MDWREATGTAQFLISVSDGSNANRAMIYTDSGTIYFQLNAGGPIIITITQSVSGYSGIQKFAYAYKQDDAVVYRNATQVGTDTDANLSSLATLDEVAIGTRHTLEQEANMWIRAVALYKTRLTNDQLADLTS